MGSRPVAARTPRGDRSAQLPGGLRTKEAPMSTPPTAQAYGVGARFSLHPMTDGFADLILNALAETDDRGLEISTDDVSTHVRGPESDLLGYLVDVIGAVARTGVHTAAHVLLSRGCPGEVDCSVAGGTAHAPEQLPASPPAGGRPAAAPARAPAGGPAAPPTHPTSCPPPPRPGSAPPRTGPSTRSTTARTPITWPASTPPSTTPATWACSPVRSTTPPAWTAT